MFLHSLDSCSKSLGNNMGLIENNRARPEFRQLPLRSGNPKYSAWGLWGENDELGTLNLLTPAIVKDASKEIITGTQIVLNLSVDAFSQPMNPVRKPCSHRIIAKGHANDDELDMNTQGSSHWDGLRHYPYQDSLLYYNGVTQDEISRSNPKTKIGIQNLSKRGIVGRGVLLDWATYADDMCINTTSPFESFEIPLSQLKAVAAQQGTNFRSGDILFIRTGWLKAYWSLCLEEQAALPHRKARTSCGVEASEEMMKWHWENQFAAVASDTVAYEAWPSRRPAGVALHEVFLSGWGMPIGESFDLERLAEKCKENGRWSFFLTSVPLDIPGGVASPPGAIAIL
ncbi:putative cyclase-domain-containing protein [Fusarium tricinctum]|uniref:Cyclase-domain-containing protein n=1 Tax=Fusarium tricinctum TaxID=61284 RepID=A0A8K0SBJ6_9HYPO|nr:putative cyclase-domain-containing protein [Fusarium tricinctum]